MRKIEAILFDMDGVLVDSEIPLMKCCIKHLKEKYGIEAKLEDFNDFVVRFVHTFPPFSNFSA